jgi:hypothetical protein
MTTVRIVSHFTYRFSGDRSNRKLNEGGKNESSYPDITADLPERRRQAVYNHPAAEKEGPRFDPKGMLQL